MDLCRGHSDGISVCCGDPLVVSKFGYRTDEWECSRCGKLVLPNDEPTLFDMNSVLMNSPRLKEIKEHDIQTHYAPHMEEFPWLAIPMNAARAMLKGSGLTENESRSVAEIMAGYCRLLDDAGMTFLGETEHDVQEDALAWCRQNERDEI